MGGEEMAGSPTEDQVLGPESQSQGCQPGSGSCARSPVVFRSQMSQQPRGRAGLRRKMSPHPQTTVA